MLLGVPERSGGHRRPEGDGRGMSGLPRHRSSPVFYQLKRMDNLHPAGQTDLMPLRLFGLWVGWVPTKTVIG